jgi:hypothetical protein
MTHTKGPFHCEEVQRQIAELPAQALASQAFGHLNAHLSTCAECRSYAEEMRALSQELNALLIPSPPEVYPDLIRALPRHAPLNLAKLVIAVTILLISLMLAIASWFYTFGPDPSTISGKRALLKATPTAPCSEHPKPSAPQKNIPNKEECSPTAQLTPERWTTSPQDPSHN